MAETLIGGRYKLTRRIVQGDASRGVADFWQAIDSGDVYYVKLWRRTKEQRGEIRGLWNREVRGLMRLQGYPGATNLFARLVDLNVTEKLYYVVLEGGRRQVLSEILRERARHSWLQNLAEPSRRRPIWEGLIRIAEALSILHNEGTLHRTLSSASILAGPEGQGDFRLSGFEWSLRVAGTDRATGRVAHRNKVLAPELDKPEGEYSPSTDWFDFGTLAAEIFGATVYGEVKREAVRKNIKALTTLRGPEKDLILSLLAEDSEERLSRSEAIIESLKNINRSLTTSVQTIGRDLVVAVRLNPDRELSRAIQRASKGLAPTSDQKKQLAWMSDDLRGDVRVVARSSPIAHFILRGVQLEYRVKPWLNNGASTWGVAYCEGIETQLKNLPDDQYFGIGERKISVESYAVVHRNFRQVSDKSVPWDKQFSFRSSSYVLPSHLKDVHDFFRVTQSLDTLITAAQICPVKIFDYEKRQNETIVYCEPVVEPERDDLASFLSMSPPAEQLLDWFKLGVDDVNYEENDEAKRAQFTFIESKKIDGDAMQAKWLFQGASQTPDGPVYEFKTNGIMTVRRGKWYLARNHEGTIAQIKRRSKAIEDMRSHEDLLRMLERPSQVSRKSDDILPPQKSNIDLDDSKTLALSNIWSTQPFYALQGPPGTGKTTLIQAFCDRLFNHDKSTQLLITAHSHHTVDDVRTKVAKMFSAYEEADRPIILRLGSKKGTEHDLDAITGAMIARLRNSDIMSNADEALRRRVEAMALDMLERSNDGSIDYRTFQLLVQDAANITFCTSNSSELAELADRGRRFDWSIIEEAGKVHGFDMAVALQESHRLLMIGDHYQLKPFNTRLFSDLLADPLRIKKAISTGVQFAGGLIDQSIVDETDDRRPFVERCQLWQGMVMLFANLFKICSEDDFARSKPAATITDQHRMHPDIADLVGRVFYPDDEEGSILKSPDETHDKFSCDPPYWISANSWLPANRIVWCDVKWVQKSMFAKGETNGLFRSDREVDIVTKILAEIKPVDGKDCTIQILSPYNDQLSAIRININRMFDAGALKQMFEPPFDLKEGKRMGATVDEFQGGEADVVIVSLVRNNGLPPAKSVGFLKESNRMNVLLSRAKHKLIVVGSYDFFSARCDDYTSEYEEYYYIKNLMDQMKYAFANGQAAKVSR